MWARPVGACPLVEVGYIYLPSIFVVSKSFNFMGFYSTHDGAAAHLRDVGSFRRRYGQGCGHHSNRAHFGAKILKQRLNVPSVQGEALPGAPSAEFFRNHGVVHVAAGRPLQVSPIGVKLNASRTRENSD